MPSKPKSSVQPPSSIHFVQFPVFAIAWHSSSFGESLCSVLAYSGGGGSAKTGVKNAIHVEITCPTHDDTHAMRTVTIDTGEAIGVSVAIIRRPLWSWDSAAQENHDIWVVVGVGDEVRLYSIPLVQNTTAEEFHLLTRSLLPKDTHGGVNAVSVNASGTLIAVGCETGLVHVCAVEKSPNTYMLNTIIDLSGHIKAVCNIRFHPRSDTILLSSAKDGTCRLWDIQAKICLDTLTCKIYDPKVAPPTNPSILNPNPGQLLVRGCAFGDIDGRIIYTIQSGRKGSAFLSVWSLHLIPSAPQPLGDKTPPPPRVTFQEVSRIVISQYPVSAADISGDFSILVLGDTNGTVTLVNTSSMKPVRRWESAHDLPVTCVAARPLLQPLMSLPGENVTGVRVDAHSVSADNKLTFLTLQHKAYMKDNRLRSQNKGSMAGFFLQLFILLLLAFMAAKISFDTCEDLFINGTPWSDKLECIIYHVWWAPKDRPGISSVPF